MTNFYAPPEHHLDKPVSGSYWINGRALVGSDPIDLPAYCVKCGSATESGGRRINQKLSWSSRWLLLLIIVNIIVLLVVYLIVRSRVNVGYSICPTCWSKLVKWRYIALGFWLAGILVVFTPYLIWSFLVFVFALVFTMLGQRPIRVSKCVKKEFFLVGFGPNFLTRIAQT